MSSLVLKGISVTFPIYRARPGITLFQKMVGRGTDRRDFFALDDVSLELNDGDKLGILGKNGSGKSTLLKVMAGVLPPSSGTIAVDGDVFPALTAAPNVLYNATCEQNIVLHGLLFGKRGDELKDYVSNVGQFSELGDFLNSPFVTLSAGMKSRFSVATLNYVDPQLLFMDEWIGAADKKVLAKNNGLLAELVNRSDIFAIASHRPDIVRNYCNKALVLEQGKIMYLGDVETALAMVA